MARRPGARRFGAFTAPTVVSILAAGFYLTSVEPATPKSLAPLPAPAAAADEPLTEPPPAVEPVVVPVAAVDVEPPTPAPEPAAEPEPCADALAVVAAAGLPLP